MSADPSHRFSQLWRFIQVKRADLMLRRLLDQGRWGTHGQWEIMETNPAMIEQVEHCIAQGATAHLKPGSVDRLSLLPELACTLIGHGAKPTERFLDEIDRLRSQWRPSPYHFYEFKTTPPQSPPDWFNALLGQALRAAPELDWNRFPNRAKTGTLDEMLTCRLYYPFKKLGNEVAQVKREHGLAPGPIGADPEIYTGMLFYLFDAHHNTRHELKWLRGKGEIAIPELVALGGDPNAKRDLGILKDAPMLAHALMGQHALVPVLLRQGVVVDEETLQKTIVVAIDSQFRGHRGNKDDTARAVATILDHARGPIDWGMIVPSTDTWRPTLEQCLRKHFPALCGRMEADRARDAMEQATEIVASRPRMGRL